MRPKRRYIMAQGSGDAMQVIKTKYAEKFGADDLGGASLKLISYNDGYLIVRCNLRHYRRLLDVIASAGMTALDTSGTLRALRARATKHRRDINKNGTKLTGDEVETAAPG